MRGRDVEIGVERQGLLVFGEGDPVKILDYESCDEKTTADNIRCGLMSRAVCGDNNVTVGIYPLILPEKKQTRGER